VAFVTATNNYKKELQFRALRHDADSMVRVRVLRNGNDVPVAVADVVVGDVLHLETGDKVRGCVSLTAAHRQPLLSRLSHEAKA
jgi:magnesium-transporting ATPase (P-type)